MPVPLRERAGMEKEKTSCSCDTFLCLLVHELKAPLNAVGGYLDIMSRASQGRDIGEYSEMIGRSILRLEAMKSMITEMTLLCSLDSGTRIGDQDEANLIEIVSAVIPDFLLDASKRNIRINFPSAPAPVVMKCYPLELRIILSNLISNAVKYNCDGGSVDISIEKTAACVIIKVSDTGISISHDDLKRLFNEFVRIKNEKTRKTEGSGLGLYIVKQLCALYNGSVSAESIPEKGSVFTVSLPF